MMNKQNFDAMANEQLAAIAELRTYDHCFISVEGALALSEPFGFKARTYRMEANPTDPKGLTLADGAKSAVGVDAADLAEQICRHLKIEYPGYLTGRGFRLRACCDALEKHFLLDQPKFYRTEKSQ